MGFGTIGIGLALIFMGIGLIGAFIPLIPGILLVWLTVLFYAAATHFSVIGMGTLTFVTVVTFIAGTANIWMSILGARTGGAGGRTLVWGIGGALVGFIVFNLLGAILGYALGILYSEYRRQGNWSLAAKAGLSGLAGWGLSTIVEAVGALLIIGVFLWRVMAQP